VLARHAPDGAEFARRLDHTTGDKSTSGRDVAQLVAEFRKFAGQRGVDWNLDAQFGCLRQARDPATVRMNEFV
jgi:hypothetical protein